MRAAIVLLGLSAVASAHAQGPAGAGAGAGALQSRDTEGKKTRQQKAAADYCLAHPMDTDKCIFLPPGVSSGFPAGVPPMPKPTAPISPSATVTENQKQRFDGTNRPSEIIIPTADPAATPSSITSTSEVSPVATFGSRKPVNVSPAPQPTYQPSCDAACVQAERQENYQAGYAVGHAVGTVVVSSIVGAVSVHKKHKFCKMNPSANWNYEDGTSATCGSINAKHEDRQYMASPEVESQLRSNADKAQGLMEVSRRDIVDIHGRYSDAPELQAMLPKMQAGWLEMRNIFCGYYRTGAYTDLDGKQQTCDGRK